MSSFIMNETKKPCPIKMSDGRSFTDYRPRCNINAELLGDLKNNKMMGSSYESRMFLQQNADLIMERNRSTMLENMTPCMPCRRPFSDSGTMYPEKYVVKCSATNCEKILVNPNGLGTSTRLY